jgi:hypothetical protein
VRGGAPTATPQEITVADEKYKVTDDGVVLVPLTLAHPMAKVYAERCQAETAKDYKVGDTVFVSREWGNALIDAGMVQVDPIDPEARQSALFLTKRNAPLTAAEIEKKLAADAEAAAPAAVEKPQSAADAKSAAKK